MLKFATAQIIAASYGDQHMLTKAAHRAVFQYEVRPGYLYVRSRAISSRCNDNHDEFPAEEIKKAYASFVGKPVFVNHNNENHRRARGIIIDAVLHEDRNPDGTPDTWVEVLMEVDAKNFPKLAKAILAGHVDRTSMGCDVERSVCSACGNAATTPAEYCAHIPGLKGRRIFRHTASGKRVGELVRETCYGLKFFENSLLVEPPADPTAHFLGVDSTGLSSTAAINPAEFDDDEPEEDDGSTLTPAPKHPSLKDLYDARERADRGFAAVTPNRTTPQIPDGWKRDVRGPARQDHVDKTPTGGVHRKDYPERLQQRRERAVTESRPFTPGIQSLNKAMAVEAAGPQYPNPGDHPWFKETGLSHEHVLSHWDQATDEEKKQGARWYPDAHHVAKAIAKLDPKITDDREAAHKGAGVLSAYSPQQNWWANQHNAARSFVQGKAVGKGEGLMVMGSHATAAQKIMNGEDHQKVLKGPKTQDFAHLIEHAGNDEHGQPSNRVVMDRHALSVAAGRRLNADQAKGFQSGNRHYYEHAAEHYRTAAAVISDREGRHVPPHEVQAVTWLTRQRLNAAEDEGSPGGKGRQTVQRNQRAQWKDLAGEHTPHLKEDGNSHVSRLVDPLMINADGSISAVAYGEIKAPQDVDTLREENCPVCGDADTYDGLACQVCGFISPPAQFRNPDLDMAKNMDLRKQVVDPSLVDDNGELQRTDQNGQPLPSQEGEADGNQLVDPDQVDENGLTPSPYGDQALDGTQRGGPAVSDRNGDGLIQPDEIDPDGNANLQNDMVDPEMGGQAGPRELPYKGQDHTGDSFTQGPDMPYRPSGPEGPDGLSSEDDTTGAPVPGTPNDGVPDLFCPTCGFGADATPPQTQNMANPEEQAMDGIVSGDVCPSCRRDQLLTPGEINGNYSKSPAVESPAWGSQGV
ncbi:hypothetical protein E6R60_26915 [Streptomyces sp. A0642]|uniref:DUF7178 family protein n=1 Tax=Streptomyces sp. A0642 TaxID=2563100 RepID=UPI0010A2A315|nr:hypothetical protein [Streptomyces sp. A0642]THA72563.1 hypothetical protein E6R60_26915 [Streptomyces sp. A0642]